MKRYSPMLERKRNVKRGFIAAACLWAAAAAPFALAAAWPGLFSSWFPAWSRAASMVVSYVTGWVPFSVGELLIAALAAGGVVCWILAVKNKHKLRAAAATLLCTGAAAALFVWLWGLNYLLPGPAAQMGVVPAPYSEDTLYAAARVLRDELNEAALPVPRGDDLRLIPPSFHDARDSVARAYKALAETYGFFSPHGAKAKRITFWPLQSYTGISGVYLPWTAEGCVNPDTPWPNIAFTMAHETAHRQGAAAEDEANFIGIVACRHADDPVVRYAGAFVAFIHMSNALNAADELMAYTLWQELDKGVLADMGHVSEHYEFYEEAFDGVIHDAGEAVNDTYLKTVGQQPEGVATYGMVADLLVAELRARGEIS